MNDEVLVELESKVQAHFSFEVKKADGSTKEATGWFPNVVLDQGIELIGTSSILDKCVVGSGVTQPQSSDTNLEVFIAETGESPEDKREPTWGINKEEGYCWTRKIFRFGQGKATGNISEVGLKAGNTLFNRALVKDSQGFYATVSVMEDETLDVTVEIRTYLDLTSKEYTVEMSGVNYSMRTEALFAKFGEAYFKTSVKIENCYACSGGITSREVPPAGNIAGFKGQGATETQREYVPGSKEKIVDLYWGLNVGNRAPLRSVVVPSNIGTYQIEFSPVIPKTSDHVLKLTFAVSWDRY